jgi:hypothetical protein
MWKIDRMGQSPMYTNQMDVANREAMRESEWRAAQGPQALPSPQSSESLSSPPSFTQQAPSIPSPSPVQGAEDIKVREGIDWRRLATAAGPALGELARGLSRPSSDRPYAQMGWEQEQAQFKGEDFAQQKLDLERQQGQDRIAAMDREIEARRQMGQEEAAQRLEALREEMKMRAELQRQEMEARYGGQISPEIAAAMGVPPGTNMREAELLAKMKESQAESAQRAAYQRYLEQQGGNLSADNARMGIEARIRAIQGNPVYAYSPEGQHELAELSKQLTPGVSVSPLPPPPAAAQAQAPAQEDPGLWDQAKNWLGFGNDPAQITQGPALQGQGGPAGPMGPPPLPPEILQVIAPLPSRARSIVEGIMREHMNDPQSLKSALRQVIDKAPPEDREAVIKVLGPIVARF